MRPFINSLLVITPLMVFSAQEMQAQEDLSTDMGRWLAAMPLDTRIADEIGRFTHDDAELSGAYRSTFAAILREIMVEEVDQAVAVLSRGPCEPSVEVTYPRQNDNDQEVRAEKEFEKSFIRTEMFACFETNLDDPTAALEIYTAADFRKEASSRIEEVWAEGDLSCVESGGISGILSPTKACNSIRRFSEGAISAEHSQVVWNEGQDPYQDIFFKESVKTFMRVPGGLALHYLNYSRTTNMGRVQRWFGTGSIEGSQRDSAELMVQRLAGENP
jgi:hypothetical protein